MKLLLDENLPKRLKADLSPHMALTVSDMNWNGKKNGELFALMIQNGFDALITFDKNLQYQPNFKTYVLPVFVLNASDNTYLTLKGLMPKLNSVLGSKLSPGPIEII